VPRWLMGKSEIISPLASDDTTAAINVLKKVRHQHPAAKIILENRRRQVQSAHRRFISAANSAATFVS